jgi:sulfate permease, SulP family
MGVEPIMKPIVIENQKTHKYKQLLKEFIPQSWISLQNYSPSVFKKDFYSGVTVGIVALPLAMSFAIASGVEPEQGLFTAIIAGLLISMLGGSKVQIGGPTGAFVVIVFDIVQRVGYSGLALATLLAGGILVVMGLCRLGTLIKYIPYPLTTGFTTGIAVIIFSSQIKDFFGLKIVKEPAGFIQKWEAFIDARHSWDQTTFMVALGTLLFILLIRRFTPRIPWGIASIAIVTLVCFLFKVPVETIVSRFGEIPRTLPAPSLPSLHFSWSLMQKIIPDAITIALLAGIESLLSAVVADGMIGAKHKSNTELFAQGIANIGSVFFGGIPATGAIARTATNVKTGAATPIAGMIHAVTLFLIMLLFAPIVSRIPLAALSAVLVMVAWNMSEIQHFKHLFKAPVGDVGILLTSFLLTVFVNLTVAVEVGMILAAFLFMKRMSDMSNVVSLSKLFADENAQDMDDPDAISKKNVPEGVEVYEINGPFFFGVADSLKDVLHNLEKPPKIFVLRMRKVPVIDATGMHALKEFYLKCKKDETQLILSGVRGATARAISKYGLVDIIGKYNIFTHIDPALKRAGELLKNAKNV